MTITFNPPGTHAYKNVTLPAGPITEIRWYRTRTGSGLLATFRRSKDSPVESVTFTTQLGGRLRRLRVLQPRA